MLRQQHLNVIPSYTPGYLRDVQAVVLGQPKDSSCTRKMLVLVQGKTAKWWIPDDVVFLKEIPHTATGKVSKMTLRQQLKDYKSAGSKL